MTNKFLFITIFLFFSFNNYSIEHDSKTKMRSLANELRCMVCQNQSLLDSDSELAKDLKNLIIQKFDQGESEMEIKSFLVDRYGEFILFKPEFNSANWMLWASPLFSIVLVGLIALRKTKLKNRKR